MTSPPRRPDRKASAQNVRASTTSPVAGEKTEKADVLAYLQNQLVAGGFTSKPLDISRLREIEATRVEKCLNAMLSKAAADLAHQTHLMGKYRNLANDFTRLEVQVSRDQSALNTSEHEREQMRSKALSASKELEKEVARHSIAKEEAAKARLALATVKGTATLENKRRENEMANTLARWQKVSSVQGGGMASITLLNPIETVGKSESAGVAVHPELRLLQESLKHAEEARSTGQEENAQLREVIGDVVNEVQATLSAISGAATPSLSETFGDELVHVPSPHLSLGPHLLTEYLSKLFLALRDATTNVASSAQADLAELKDKHAREADGRVQELEESLAAMQLDLDEARAQAEEAQSALEAMSRRQQQEQEAQTSLQAQEQIEQTKRSETAALELRKQRKALEVERKKATEASSQLALQKAELGKERSAFATEKMERRQRRQEEKEKPNGENNAAPASPKKARKAPSSNALRQSTTSSALQSILAAGKDTPPVSSRALAATRPNVAAEGGHNTKTALAAEKPAKGMEEISARDRVQKALQAAKSRSDGA